MRAALAVTTLLVGRLGWSMGLLEKNHPLVDQGMQAYQKGEYDSALRAFEDAKKELPNSAAVEFNRGNTLYKLGRLDEAKQAYNRVGELDRGELRAKDLYNLGNAWAQLGNDREAIAAYRKALTLNPNDNDARHNLEVILRKIPPPSPDAGTDGGTDGGRDGGTDGGVDGGQADGGGDGGQGSGQGTKEGRDGGSDGGSNERQEQAQWDAGVDGGQPNEDSERADAGTAAGQLTREQVEKLLDSMKSDERNLQLWRFQKKPRKPSEKDW